ncbi:hypothetical protein ACLOJK_002786 [Asimina triloba]
MEASASCSFNRIAVSLPKSKPVSFPFNLHSLNSASSHQGIRSRLSPFAFFPVARLQRHPVLRFRKAIPDGRIAAVDRASGGEKPLSPLDEKPYEVLPDGRISYLDEQDIVTLLDPLRELKPLDPSSYNPAAYLWKKIDDIPEERRPRLLYLLEPRLISRLWAMAGTRYEDSKLIKKNASSAVHNLLNIGVAEPAEVLFLDLVIGSDIYQMLRKLKALCCFLDKLLQEG